MQTALALCGQEGRHTPKQEAATLQAAWPDVSGVPWPRQQWARSMPGKQGWSPADPLYPCRLASTKCVTQLLPRLQCFHFLFRPRRPNWPVHQPCRGARTCSQALRSLLSLTGLLVRLRAYSQPSMRCVALNTMLNPPRPSSLTCLNSELRAGRQVHTQHSVIGACFDRSCGVTAAWTPHLCVNLSTTCVRRADGISRCTQVRPKVRKSLSQAAGHACADVSGTAQPRLCSSPGRSHCCRTASTTRVPPTHLSRDTVGQCRGFLLSKACGWSPSPPVLKGFLKEAGDIGRPGPPKRLGPRSPREGTGGRLKLQPAASSHSSEQALRVSISNRCRPAAAWQVCVRHPLVQLRLGQDIDCLAALVGPDMLLCNRLASAQHYRADRVQCGSSVSGAVLGSAAELCLTDLSLSCWTGPALPVIGLGWAGLWLHCRPPDLRMSHDNTHAAAATAVAAAPGGQEKVCVPTGSARLKGHCTATAAGFHCSTGCAS